MAGKKQPVLTLEQAAEKYGFDIEFDEVRTRETHCGRGHRFIECNLRRNGKGQRLCAICDRQRRGRVLKTEKIGFTHCPNMHPSIEENLINDITNWGEILRCRLCIAKKRRNYSYGPGAGEWYEQRVLECGGRCDICKDLCDTLELDHNHVDGEWRGVLCGPCNKFVGYLEKRKDMLEKYLNYIGSDC